MIQSLRESFSFCFLSSIKLSPYLFILFSVSRRHRKSNSTSASLPVDSSSGERFIEPFCSLLEWIVDAQLMQPWKKIQNGPMKITPEEFQMQCARVSICQCFARVASIIWNCVLQEVPGCIAYSDAEQVGSKRYMFTKWSLKRFGPKKVWYLVTVSTNFTIIL